MPAWLAQYTSNAKSEATRPSTLISNGTYVNNRDEVYEIYTASKVAIMFVDELGNLKEAMWVGRWVEFFSFPKDICDNYGRCGVYGYCDSDSNAGTEFECTCLPGYEPRSIDEWYLGDASGGCIKKREALSMCGNGEGFVKVANAKIPDSSKARVWMSLSMDECKEECLRNCSCLAYVSEAEKGKRANCFTWPKNLMDVRKFVKRFPKGGLDLYVRVDAVELAQHMESRRTNGKMVAIVVTPVVLTSVLIITLICLLVKKNQRRGKDIPESDDENVELPIFDMLTISGATNNFSETNKIGEGGFGSVYKGRLSTGKDIAVKRLSTDSKQDFGLARAFGGDQSLAKTKRVVGTYGYMAPEYAFDGIFSTKSDIFSFGVIVLEIISGKRNRKFHHVDHDLNLLGHAWKLWIDGKASELIDPLMEDKVWTSNMPEMFETKLHKNVLAEINAQKGNVDALNGNLETQS
ncbi:hypothetical protein Vadar_009738 [Vaccinium darrowii]|uniref:Uncharacterized protein n=1 Tax=Vaccinium darrowii TaxID=229202 RepID=A0ACB7YUL3_9ERIC|nr:hypothetical protein Vadar_009738 [Vaccinium darrowii]